MALTRDKTKPAPDTTPENWTHIHDAVAPLVAEVLAKMAAKAASKNG